MRRGDTCDLSYDTGTGRSIGTSMRFRYRGNRHSIPEKTPVRHVVMAGFVAAEP
jgi:hypothetical protein